MVRHRWAVAFVTALPVALLATALLSRGATFSPDVLLCSDGRCGESSKLSRQGALRDLDMWADKEELKNKLDELQTVMDRGMTHRAASQQLNQYFSQLDQQVQRQRKAALKQEQREGLALTKLAPQPNPPSDANHQQQIDTSSPAQPQLHHAQDPNLDLLKYFDQQDHLIKQENSEQEAHVSKLSAAAAEADLNKYFDSLPTSSRTGKVKALESQVASLSKEVKQLSQPISDIQSAAQQTSKTVSRLSEEDKQLQQDDQQHGRDISDAADRADRAERAAEAAAKKADAIRSTVVLASIKDKPAHSRPNPRIRVLGLPPGWQAFMDRRTKYTYFYNPSTKLSTWDSPAGTPADVEGLPKGWKAYRAKEGGRLYYVSRTDDKATWQDPRVLAGAKVLALLNSVDEKRQLAHSKRVRASMLAAFKSDHGVYGHVYPRSQWADPTWMKFLTSSEGPSAGTSLLTNAQRLRRGLPGAAHALAARAESRHYDAGPRGGPPV